MLCCQIEATCVLRMRSLVCGDWLRTTDLAACLAMNTKFLETAQCKADGSSHGSLVVPIELAMTCIIFVSDHQLLCKLLSVLGSGLKPKHTCFQRECKQDARL